MSERENDIIGQYHTEVSSTLQNILAQKHILVKQLTWTRALLLPKVNEIRAYQIKKVFSNFTIKIFI